MVRQMAYIQSHSNTFNLQVRQMAYIVSAHFQPIVIPIGSTMGALEHNRSVRNLSKPSLS